MRRVRRASLLLLLALVAGACAGTDSRAKEPDLVDPIAAEIDGDGIVRVEGVASTWEALPEAVGRAFAARARRKGWRPAAEVAVSPGAPPDSAQRLLDALTAAGVREFELVPWNRRRVP